MASKKGYATIARQYRDKYGMEMPTQTLAKIMFQERGDLFDTLEDARFSLRYIEGKTTSGKDLEGIKNSKYFKKEERPRNPYNIPESESDDLVPFELHWDDFIVAADFHIPNHRTEPIKVMLDYAYENNVRNLFINGDLLDNTPFSRWEHEPVNGTDVKRWFDQAIAFLEEMKKHFDSIIWLEGNHDFWYTRWLMTRCELMFGDPYFSLVKRLDLDRIGVTYLDQKNLVKAGKLFISHGHVLVKGGGVHAAHAVVQRSGASHLISHLHREQSFTKTTLGGDIHTGYVTGCMCTLSPDYQRYGGQACHGFAHVKVRPDRDFIVRNYRIHNGVLQ